MRTVIAAAAAGVIFAAPAAVAQPAAQPTAAFTEAAPRVWFMPGVTLPNREPDGATVIFDAGGGRLVVMDTGRHLWRRQAILDFARRRRARVVAIVNSHWHLDHVSGNADLRRAFPQARVYASTAVDGALTGFLARNARDSAAYLAPGKLPPETQEDIRGDLATIQDPQALRPDRPVTATTTVRFGARSLQLHLASDAATAGDVWVFDPKTRTAAIGDLVTLPAAFLDTACPKGWSRALSEIALTPFVLALPGHGPPLTRASFDIYRAAFETVITCAATETPAAACADAWTRSVDPLLDAGTAAREQARQMTAYYVQDVLRAHGGRSTDCHEA